MAIYSRNGAPVEIVTAREVTVWIVKKPGRIDWHYEEPKPRKGWKIEPTPVMHVTAKRIGVYPDGSGEKSIGEMLFDGTEFPLSDLIADAGFAELSDTAGVITA